MTNENTQIEIGSLVLHIPTNTIQTVIEHAKGWYTIADVEDVNGSTNKARAKDLELHEEDRPSNRMADKLARARVRYESSIAYSGAKSLNNGDDVAHMLAGMLPADTIRAAEILLDLEEGSLAAKYAHLNPGQIRMNASNRIRGAIKRGDNTVADVAHVLSALH